MIEVWGFDIEGNDDNVLGSYIVRDMHITDNPNKIIAVLPWHDEKFPWEGRPYVEFAPVKREGHKDWTMSKEWFDKAGDDIRFYYIEDERHFQYVLIVREIPEKSHLQQEYADKEVTHLYNTELQWVEE